MRVKAVFLATNGWFYPTADLERCSEDAVRAWGLRFRARAYAVSFTKRFSGQ